MPPASPQTTDTQPDPKIQIARINELSLIARTTWFGLLAYLAFVGITLLGVEDADFFVPSRQTQLPLVNVAIPTSSFFWFAPILGAALYAFLHLQLLKLWEALATPPPTLDGKHLSELIHPWLISDYALSHRTDNALRERPLAWLSHLATWGLVWLAGPVILTGFWLRSMPAHDVLMTLIIGLCLMNCLHVAFTSHWTLTERMADPHGKPAVWNRNDRFGRSVFVTVFIWIAGLTMTVGIPGVPGTPEPANLRGVELVAKPANWLDHATARKRFRAIWCKRKGIGAEVCGNLYTASDPIPAHVGRMREEWCQEKPRSIKDCTAQFATLDREFSSEWAEEWAGKIDALPNLDLRDRDFRGADMAFAFLAGVDFRSARMEGANLSWARMEGADLRGARMERANLREARMEGADLREARMERASLFLARMEGANLIDAQMEGADLSWARMEGASLFRARMEGANLFEARMEGAYLFEARMEGANLSGARMERANLIGARMERANLRGARMEGAFLREARMEGANLFEAQMEGRISVGRGWRGRSSTRQI